MIKIKIINNLDFQLTLPTKIITKNINKKIKKSNTNQRLYVDLNVPVQDEKLPFEINPGSAEIISIEYGISKEIIFIYVYTLF